MRGEPVAQDVSQAFYICGQESNYKKLMIGT